MKNLIKSYKNNIVSENEKMCLYFSLGGCKYGVNLQQVVEIMKLPMLEYPQKLANNVIGLLNYNNFTINVFDLRFYLNIKVTTYSPSNQILIVKTDESIFGLLVDKVEDIISIEESKLEYFSSTGELKIIEFLYKNESETISIIDLAQFENAMKEGFSSVDVDIPSLFPQDEASREKLLSRNQAMVEKNKMNFVANWFSQDKFISFAMGSGIYCITLEYVKELLKDVQITPIPCDKKYILGVITLRGDFITIVDLKNILDLAEPIATETIATKNNIIVVETADFKIGFYVDEIFRIVEIPENIINENAQGSKEKYVSSEVVLNDKIYTILNMPTILMDEKFYIEE